MLSLIVAKPVYFDEVMRKMENIMNPIDDTYDEVIVKIFPRTYLFLGID